MPALVPACTHKATIAGPKTIKVSKDRYFATNFGIDEDTIRRTLARALKGGGDYSDIYFQHKVMDYVGFEDGSVNRAYAQVDLGAGIRVLRGDQTGYAYTEDLSIESLLAAADTAASIASSGPTTQLRSFATVKMPDLYERKQVWIDISANQKIDLVQKLGDKLLAKDSSVIKASIFTVNADEVFLLANSEGDIVEDTRPMTVIYVNCVAEKQGRRESNGYRLASREGIDFYTEKRLDEIVDTAVQRTMLLFDADAPPAGEMAVVLAPATSGILLHEAIGHGMEADFIRKGTSIYSTMMGKTVAEEFVTIVDTALEPKSRGAIHVDDEGVPGQRTVLIENGKLVSFLHDRISARHFKTKPTGNGRRESFRYAPLPRMRVTTMENGPHDPGEIIKSVKKGLYAVDFTNGEVQIGAGDYSFYVKTGYLIEDGKLTKPVKDANLIGNGPDTLTKVVMVGNDKAIDLGSWTCGKDGQSVPVSLGLPTVKVSSITVGGMNS
ncbi:MAG: TldD/PmbA family protein [Proteobacteria bacterium]|nr:TldD/PmbA family protein [Pseudomonadota bacterium]